MSTTDPITIANWQRLCRAAENYANKRQQAATAVDVSAAANELSSAARAYVGTIPASKPQRREPSGGHVIPFGRSKDTPIHEAETKDLRWVASALRESIDDPAKEKWRAKNAELLEAIDAELEAR